MAPEVITKIRSLGFQVYMRKPGDSYLLFTDGTRIGYLQEDRGGGLSLTTVHRANQRTGTGFQAAAGVAPEALDRPTLERAFAHGPSFPMTSDDLATIKKWRDMDAFVKADSWNAGYSLVQS